MAPEVDHGINSSRQGPIQKARSCVVALHALTVLNISITAEGEGGVSKNDTSELS